MRGLAHISFVAFIRYNFLSRNVSRKRGCYLVPYRGAVIRLAPSSRIVLGGSLKLNAGKYPGSRAESFLALDEGAKLSIEDDSRINYGSTVHVNEGADLSIGSLTTNVGVNIQVRESVSIGLDCMFGRSASVLDSSFHPTGPSPDALSTKTHKVTIGDHVWVGAGASIAAGATIGDCCIVGQSAFVNGEVRACTTILHHADKPAFVDNMWARGESDTEIASALRYYGEFSRGASTVSEDKDARYREVRELLSQVLPELDDGDLDGLLSKRRLDSLSLVELVTSLERTYGIKIPYYEINQENFDSPHAIAMLVSKLTTGNAPLVHAMRGVDSDGASSYAIHESGGISKRKLIGRHDCLIAYVREHAEHSPQKVAILASEASCSYKQLYDRASRFGSYLVSCGLRRGDRMVVRASQTIGYIVTYLGAHYAGVVVTTIESGAPPERVLDIARRVSARALACDDDTPPGVWESVLVIRPSRVLSQLDDIKAMPINRPDGDDPADILFTTGTTGESKGVELSHRAVVAGAENIACGCEMRDDTVLVVPNPLSHSNAIKNLGACLITGCTFHVLDGITNLGSYFDALSNPYGRVATVLPPAAIRIILRLARERLADCVGSLDYLMAATAPLPEPDRQTLREVLPNTRLYNHYGCSESSSICIYDFAAYPELKNCVGRAMPHSRVFFVDDDRQEIKSSPDNIGLLAVSGDATMIGYFGQPELTSEVKSGEIIYTSDIGYIDSEGFVFVMGRADDMINVGGLKVSPLEIEAVALSCNGIADCVCISVNDDISGQAPLLLIVPGDGYSSNVLVTTLSAKLEPYKVPRRIETVEKVEKTYNGKVNRKYYRDWPV